MLSEERILTPPAASFVPRKRWAGLWQTLAVMGPGLTVMLADTDAGSIVTAAQSGARWGYRLLLLQILLIPILYFVQDLTTRVGATSQRGFGALIREHFGPGWSWFSALTLFVSAIGALVTELTGIAGVGLLFGVPQWASVLAAAFLLIVITGWGRYSFVERTAIIVGLFELAFLPAVFLAHPDPKAVVHIFGSQPWHDRSYWLLIAANVGAVIMPWMIYYQEGAVVDKGLTAESIKLSRWDTIIGSVATQVIMAAVLVLTAATIGRAQPNASLANIQQIADALVPLLGPVGGKVLFSLGVTGSALIAAIVVSLATSWTLGDVLGIRASLNCSWREAPVFYILYSGGIVIAAAIVLLGLPLVSLTIAVEIMNTLLLPIVLGFLIVLAWRTLPQEYRLRPWEKVVLLVIYGLVCSLGIFTIWQI